MNGFINSFQSLGAVDGPGIRFVVFMQGCPLRCAYCHNPETWSSGGEQYTPKQVFDKILRYRPYFKNGGGVTVSGGEPLMQWEFTAELFSLLREAGINTALDTSGTCEISPAREVLKNTGLVLCDLKFSNEEDYRRFCGGSLKTVLSFLELTEKMNVPLWIRHVVVPGLTDSEESVLKIAEIARRFSNFKKLELLPFRKICSSKYEALSIPFRLRDCPECSGETIERLYRAAKLK